MKTLAKLLLSIACLGIFATCEKDPDKDYQANEPILFSAGFDVQDFSQPGIKMAEGPGNGCSRTWAGEGNSALFGDFSVEITLTCYIQPGETCGNFCDLKGTFTTIPSGDEMYFMILKGSIGCNPGPNCDEFQTCFNDLATITGGTGIFAGSHGDFYPNALIHNGSSEEWHARFESEGSIWFYENYSTNSIPRITGNRDK